MRIIMKRFAKSILMVATVAISAAMLASPASSTQEKPTVSIDSQFNTIEVSRDKAVLLLRINTPPRNVVSKATLGEIKAGLDIAEGDETIGAVVITGSDKVFSSGAGGESLQKTPAGQPTQAFIAHEVYRRIEGFPKPVIAAIAGISAGGGNELAMSCDIRIAGKSAKFRQHELQAGLIPGFGGMQRLQHHVGRSRAMEIMLTGRFVGAEEALSIGLVTSVVPDDEVVVEAITLGQNLTDNLDRNALAVFKRRMAASYDESFRVALSSDQIAFDQLATSEETKAAIARFIQKQKELQKK
jgi:enoyl-CoA hydratase/carnithine racemase